MKTETYFAGERVWDVERVSNFTAEHEVSEELSGKVQFMMMPPYRDYPVRGMADASAITVTVRAT
jgi:hypothetical protein